MPVPSGIIVGMKFEVTDEILDYLCKADPIFVSLFHRYGLISFDLPADPFASFIHCFAEAMLSQKAANTIYKRIEEVAGSITPEALSLVSPDDLRKCGISSTKVSYIKGFSASVASGQLDLSTMAKMDDQSLMKFLLSIKGVGPWTAEMICLFTLGKEDVWSFGDVALKNGIMKAKGLKSMSKTRFERIGKKYAPYRSYASLYFYRVNDDEDFR